MKRRITLLRHKRRMLCFIIVWMCLVYSQMYTPIQANAVSNTRSANSSIASQSEEGVEELKDNSEYGNTEDSSNGPIDRSVGSTENNIEKENEEKKSNSISILGVVLGGLLTLLGTIVSSMLGSKEASRQREFQFNEASRQQEFQLEQERKKRNDEYNKELILNRKTTYIAYIESLFNLYYCIKNNSNQYDECIRNVSNNYAKIALIGSKDVVDKSRIIAESVYKSMIANDLSNNISELEKTMRKDIEIMTVDVTSNTDTQPSQ